MWHKDKLIFFLNIQGTKDICLHICITVASQSFVQLIEYRVDDSFQSSNSSERVQATYYCGTIILNCINFMWLEQIILLDSVSITAK